MRRADALFARFSSRRGGVHPRPAPRAPQGGREARPYAWITLLATLVLLTDAHAGGFLVYEQGAKAHGMGGAFAAVADDPTALYYNPAGLAFQPNGVAITAGLSLITASLSTTPKFVERDATGQVTGIRLGDKVEAEAGLFAVPYAFVTATFLDQFAAGIGVFPHLGLGVQWPDGKEWDVGRQEIEAVNLQVITINPCVAWRPAKWFSVAAGFDAATANIEFKRGLDFMQSGWDPDAVDSRFGRAELGGSGWGFGANAGILVRPIDWLSFGAHYRSRFNIAMTGKGHFEAPEAFAESLPDQDLDLEITLPDILSVGVAVRPLDWLLLQLEVTQVWWSTWDVLEVEFAETPDNNIELEQHWMDGASYRIGLEADLGVLAEVLDRLKFRTGFIYDLSPAPSTHVGPALPDGNRYDWTVGLGYTLSEDIPLTLNLGYILIVFDRDDKVALDSRGVSVNPWPAKYNGTFHSFGLDLSYRFGI